jgi:hypothetical protein
MIMDKCRSTLYSNKVSDNKMFGIGGGGPFTLQASQLRYPLPDNWRIL